MKKTIKMHIKDGKVVSKTIRIDETILEGLFLVADQHKIMRNIKKFKISVVEFDEEKGEMGIRFSKDGPWGIVTCHIKDPSNSFYIQYFVSKHVSEEEILTCGDPMIEGSEKHLVAARKLAAANTLEELMEIPEFAKQ